MRRIAIGIALVVTGLGSGCVFQEVARQHARERQLIHLSGNLSATQSEDRPLIAVLVKWPEAGEPEIIDHFVRRRPGRFFFVVAEPGTYSIPAFHDRNRNFVFEPDEPAVPTRPETRFDVVAGDRIEDIEIVIHPDERIPDAGPVDLATVRARAPGAQVGRTMGQLSVLGEITELADPRFGAESGSLGLWRPIDFVIDIGAGIYFLEPFDPERVPVLFVHGATGYPQEFLPLLEALDTTRFQPWVYFYPSGARLEFVVRHLDMVVTELEARHGFDELAIVAHSMGGLVARSFVQRHQEETGIEAIRLMVTLAAPWSGHAAAQSGVDRAPAVVHSWRDLAPGSDFLEGLFYDSETEARRSLPEATQHHLLFGFRRREGRSGPSSDSVITLESQLRPEAQQDADAIYGYDATHTGILELPETSALLNGLLEGRGE